MEFFGRAEEEMQAGFQKLTHVFLADFHQHQSFGDATAVSKQFAGFSIQDPHFTLFADGVITPKTLLE